jgi:hypothetical protein
LYAQPSKPPLGSGAAQTFCTAVHKSLFIIRMAMRLEQKMGGCVLSKDEAGDVFSLMLVTGLLGLVKNQ